jgi:hypothetical protein
MIHPLRVTVFAGRKTVYCSPDSRKKLPSGHLFVPTRHIVWTSVWRRIVRQSFVKSLPQIPTWVSESYPTRFEFLTGRHLHSVPSRLYHSRDFE